MNIYDAIRDIAVPVALFISIVMQKLEGIKTKRIADAAEASRALMAKTLAEQKQILEAQNAEALRAAKDVKDTLARATVAQQVKMEEIHVDVNSKMGEQKKKTWEFARALALRPGSTPEDAANARAAEKDYLDHMENQARADERVRAVRREGQDKTHDT